MSQSIRSIIFDAEGDMLRVYDHAYVIHSELSDANRITEDMQHALLWSSGDLVAVGERLREHFDAMHKASRGAETGATLASEPAAGGQLVHFDPSPLSIEDIWHLHDALGVIFEVMNGLISQPRFNIRRTHELTPAGDVLEAVSEAIAGIVQQCLEEMECRPAQTRADKERKFGMLGADCVDGLSEPKAALAKLQKIAANLTP